MSNHFPPTTWLASTAVSTDGEDDDLDEDAELDEVTVGDDPDGAGVGQEIADEANGGSDVAIARPKQKKPQKSPGQLFLERAGYIRQAKAKGVYNLLPLGFRVHRNICDIIYDEMEADGVQNLQLSILQVRSLWELTDRWADYVRRQTMFQTQSHHGGKARQGTREPPVFGLAPTAEEMVTAMAADGLNSYRQLPLILHQIGPKFRDEVGPRGALLRSREFVMSDAYSFDVDEEGMRRSYNMFRELYTRIFNRVGLPEFISVQADSGAIGGSGSAEFMALTKSSVGQSDTLMTCDECDYGANVEKAEAVIPKAKDSSSGEVAMSFEHTPDTRTVAELQVFFPDIPDTRMLKTIIFVANADTDAPYFVAVCIRGDLEIQDVKLANALPGTPDIRQATAPEVRHVTHAEVGFAGPINIDRDLVTHHIYDESAREMSKFLCGLNKTDYHAINVDWDVDLPRPSEFKQVAAAQQGYLCPQCKVGKLVVRKGVEIGHIFMLQRKYSGPTAEEVAKEEELAKAEERKPKRLPGFAMRFDGEGEKNLTPWMGCYGIGTTRLMQAVAEQCHDEDGLIWPESIAPYRYHLVVTSDDAGMLAMADEIYEILGAKSTLYDDRTHVRAGVKFKDADLLGMPHRIVVGRDASEGVVEVRSRKTGEVRKVSLASIREGKLN